jgi:uncharacterized membrane protein YphA (DoxX/SURF4 family)
VKDLVLAGCRVVIGALFLYAASTKVPDMAKFAEEVANYRMLPAALVPVTAAAVVGVEIVAGLALVTGVLARAGAVAISALLVVFIGGIAQALLRGIDLKCGCFGAEEAASWGTVVRDLAMLAPALAVAWWGPGRPWSRRAAPAPRGAPADAHQPS